jgi:hypothetical protein
LNKCGLSAGFTTPRPRRDAFYTGVSPAGIQAGLRSLAAGGTPARLLIVDGWQQTELDSEFRRGAAERLEESMGGWRPQEVARRRASAELLFQD